MAISRMQQPRQNYGLGSFVKKLTRKVTKPFTKVARKIVPKEIAGIMRIAAPFMGPVAGPLAYLAGTAKQKGRISPMDLALTAAPTFFSKTDMGRGIAQRVGDFTLPGMDTNLRDITLGTPAVSGTDVPLITRPGGELTGKMATLGARDATSGILGSGGKFFQFGVEGSPKILDTKAGEFLLGGKDGGFSKSKIAGLGVGVLSLISSAKTPQEAGTALASQTGNSDDYERGYQLFSQLKPELFQVPEQFRMPVKDGGRIGFSEGTGRRGGLGSMERSMGPDMAADRKSDFFEDLFLNRAGGGGKDYMMPMEASERTFNEIFTIGGDDMKKAKEIEAERIFPILQDKAMQIIDVVLDMPESEEREKILYDINHGHLDNAEGTGMTKIANARYETIQKYGYLLDKPGGLGSMGPRKAQQADGGLMRTNFAMGSDDDPKPLPEDPTKPVNPFGPKPIKPLGDMKMAGSDRYQRILEDIINEMEDALGRELTNEEYDLAGQLAYEKLNSPPGSIDYAKGGRVNYALGTRPTAQESGLGGLPIEADMRYTGGFMPYGAKEKADDVPARLSKNEFVFTADAVRAAGGGSVQKGAQKMYNTMKQLEAKPEAKGMMA